MSHRPYPNVARARRRINRQNRQEQSAPLLSDWVRSLSEGMAAAASLAQEELLRRIVIPAPGRPVLPHAAEIPGTRAALARESVPEPSKKCGFMHEQWDGPYRMRKRCIAPEGHSAGRFAYDHGPWEGVSPDA